MSILIDLMSVLFFLSAISATGSNMLSALMAVGIFLMIIVEYGWKLERSELGGCLFLFLLFVGVEIMISGNLPFEYLLSRFSSFFPIILGMYYIKKERANKILAIVILIWIMVSVRAALLLSTGAMSGRALAAHLQTNIPFSGGGYAFATGSAIFAVYLLDLLLWTKQRKILFVPVIILLSYVVVLTQSTTTIVALFAGLFASAILRISSVSKLRGLTNKQLVNVFLLGVICITVVLLKDKIGDIIIAIGYGKKDILSRRIVEFGSILSKNSQIAVDTSDSEGRFTRLTWSIKLFFQHPIFGVTGITGTNHYAQAAYGVGSHGELFDALARFGLLAGIPYLRMFFIAIIKNRDNHMFALGFGYVVTFVILFVFNPCLYMSVNTLIFFVLPLITNEINKHYELEEKALC